MRKIWFLMHTNNNNNKTHVHISEYIAVSVRALFKNNQNKLNENGHYERIIVENEV